MNISIITKKEVDLQQYYVLRGIRGEIGGEKRVIAEREFVAKPSAQDVAKFIMETGCDFASAVINYRIAKADDLPFA